MSAKIIEDWASYFFPRSFIGREEELRLLERELLQSEARAVCILGGPGMGKTALAMAFAQTHRDSFRAGAAYQLRATPFEPLHKSVATQISNPSSPYLVTIDDVDARPLSTIGPELLELRRLRPTARLILTSRHELPSAGLDFTIHLGGLDESSFNALLRNLLAQRANLDLSKEMFDRIAGNPLALAQISDLMLGKSALSPRDVVQRLRDFSFAGLLGPDGLPIAAGSAASKRIIVDITTTNDEILQRLHKDPRLLHELSWRRFEEIVAEILNRLGYEVTLTPGSKDGGTDIYAARKDDLGTFLYLVECKKYAPDHPVGVDLIRQLNGVVEAQRATGGILATTSYFTKGANEFQRQTTHRISLKDYLNLQEWISKAQQPR